MRYSAQREAIWEWIRNRHDHPTAEQVHVGVQEAQPGIGLATVYRNLCVLEEQGKVQSVDLGDGAVRYDPLTSRHAHFKCTTCGRVVDVPERYVLCMEEAPLEGIGTADGYRLCFTGTCASCQTENRKD